MPLGDWPVRCRKVIAAWSAAVLLGLGVVQERHQRARARCRAAAPSVGPPPAGAAARRGAARHRAGPPGSSRGSAACVRFAQLLLHARQMAAGDVAAFVRHDADQLVGPSRCA